MVGGSNFLFPQGEPSALSPGSTRPPHPLAFKVLRGHMFAHRGAGQRRTRFYDLHPGCAVNTPGSIRLGSCQVNAALEPRRRGVFEGRRQTTGRQ